MLIKILEAIGFMVLLPAVLILPLWIWDISEWRGPR
jgi:hypothetical protein